MLNDHLKDKTGKFRTKNQINYHKKGVAAVKTIIFFTENITRWIAIFSEPMEPPL